MSNKTREVLFAVGYAAVGLIAAAAVGLQSYHMQFFHATRTLSFLALGLTGGLIYAAAQMRSARYAVLIVALLFLARSATTSGSYWLAKAAVNSLPVGFALMAGTYVQKSLTRVKFGRFISMGLFVGAGFALVLMMMLFARPDAGIGLGAVCSRTLLGAKLGAAMGLGFELIDFIGPRPTVSSSQSG